jgi:hypothetical protein
MEERRERKRQIDRDRASLSERVLDRRAERRQQSRDRDRVGADDS